MENIIWAGFSMTLFAAIIMTSKRKPGVSDRLLAAWLFLFAIDFGNLGITAACTDHSMVQSSFFLYNPAFYLYARSFTESGFSLKWRQLIHLIPYVFFEIAKLIHPFTLNIDYFFVHDHLLWLRLSFAIALIASLSIYNIRSILIVHRHRINLKNIFSNISKNQKITWLLFILVSYMVFVFTVVTWGVLGFLTKDLETASIYNLLASISLTFLLGFYGIKQEDIFIRIQRNKEATKSIKKTYQYSSLSKTRKKEIAQLILHYFNTKKPYLNPELNMPMLAEELNLPKHQVTEVLNTEIGKNFFQFVNEYRVKAVQQRLADQKNDHYSIEAIGYDCGFSSKSSFFAFFKTATGKTPLQYKKSVRG